MTNPPHLWLALSPHGYGHAAMTAPVIAELRRRMPDLRLTIQTAVPRAFLDTRYADFTHVDEIPDFGFRMISSTEVDLEASAQAYNALHEDFDGLVTREADRLAAARPHALLANVPYVAVAAAARAGIPAVAMSSLNWADMYQHYYADRPEAGRILPQIRESYAQARVFLRCLPAQAMTLPNLRDIGPVARRGKVRRDELHRLLGLDPAIKVGMVAFGGIDHDLDMERFPHVPGWFWIINLKQVPDRADMVILEDVALPFADLLPSVDVVIGKPGYGTFTEAGLSGTPVLHVPRDNWPESAPLEEWLANHTRSLQVEMTDILGSGLEIQLQKLFSLKIPQLAQPTGVSEAADAVCRALEEGMAACERS